MRTTGQRQPLEVPKLKVVFTEACLTELELCGPAGLAQGTETPQAVCGVTKPDLGAQHMSIPENTLRDISSFNLHGNSVWEALQLSPLHR